MRVCDLTRLLEAIPSDAEIRIAFSEDPFGSIGHRDLPINGISDCFKAPNAPDLAPSDSPKVYWIVTSHLIDVTAKARTSRKKVRP